MALDHKTFRLQDVPQAFWAVASNRFGHELVLNYFLENWDRIYKSLGRNFISLQGVINACLSKGHTKEHLDKAKDFMKNHWWIASFNQFHMSLEMIGVRMAWIKAHYKPLMEFIKSHS
ncbi:hypothetical protein OSTOST_05637 [Ostertagia ostertagi]